ncbi:MAG: helix-turn-helix domain-containing protein [Nitrospiria bacterium]
MDKIIKNALWFTFLLYLTVSYVNTARLASEFETNIIMCNLWALAVEIGDVTLLLGTLKRKREGKPYFGYMATFMVSLAVSVAANGLEGSNTFLGNNTVFASLHEFQYPWILPWMLGLTIPALMLATSSMLADFSLDISKNVAVGIFEQSTNQDVKTIEKEETPQNFNQQINVQILNTPPTKKEETNTPLTRSTQLDQSEPDIEIKNRNCPPDLFELSIRDAASKYNVSERTIRNWKAKYSSNLETNST